MQTKTCEQCQQPFEATKSNQRFCSNACKMVDYRKRKPNQNKEYRQQKQIEAKRAMNETITRNAHLEKKLATFQEMLAKYEALMNDAYYTNPKMHKRYEKISNGLIQRCLGIYQKMGRMYETD